LSKQILLLSYFLLLDLQLCTPLFTKIRW